jgi:hypothetical protein
MHLVYRTLCWRPYGRPGFERQSLRGIFGGGDVHRVEGYKCNKTPIAFYKKDNIHMKQRGG